MVEREQEFMTLKVELTSEQEALVQRAVKDGRYATVEDVLKAALSLWEERERRRMEIILAVEDAEASYARGEGRIINTREESRQLAEEINRRGMARLAREMGTTSPL
jgi:Arc/MetJ-type ribon-helix-helix transcriptional regulator